MNTRIILSLLLLSFLYTYSFSQTQTAYRPFTSKAPIPQEFLATSTEKYESNVEKLQSEDSRYLKKVQDQFYLESSFMVDGLLKSGRVLFNDQAGIYINKVADQILKDKPALRKKLRFYVVKSPVPNAFTTERGTILINLGLLARLETEAQLAYILCHEITHYQKKHVLKRFLEYNDIELQKGDYKGLSEYDKLLEKNNYSQENETEADLLGLELFKESGYSSATILNVFDILERADYAMLTRSENYTPLLSTYYNEEDWENASETSKKSESTDKDSPNYNAETEDEPTDTTKLDSLNEDSKTLSTHPAPIERKAKIEAIISTWESENAEESFIVSSEDFVQIRESSKFAVIESYLASGYFLDALHQILALSPDYPDDFFLKKNLAHCLYSIAKYRNHKKKMALLFNYNNSKQDKLLLENIRYDISRENIRILAITHLWDFFEAHEEDSDISKALLNDLIFDLHNDWEKDSKENKSAEKDSLTRSKIALLNEQGRFKYLFDVAKEEQKEFSNFIGYIKTNKGARKFQQYKNRQNNGGYYLGIDKLVVFDPIFYRIDFRKKKENPLEFIASEKQLAVLHENINRASKKLNLETKIIDSKILSNESNYQAFEDYGQITQWHNQWNREPDFRFVPSNYDEVQEISERYGTPYFMQMGAISGKFPKSNRDINNGIFHLVLPTLWPIGVHKIIAPKERGFIFTLVYDVRNNRRMMNQFKGINMKTTDGNLSTHIFYNLKQANRKKAQ